MSSINDGGPAFPTDALGQIGPKRWHHAGMTLREYYAGQALAGIISNNNFLLSVSEGDFVNTEKMVAQLSVSYADAIIAALKETEHD